MRNNCEMHFFHNLILLLAGYMYGNAFMVVPSLVKRMVGGTAAWLSSAPLCTLYLCFSFLSSEGAEDV